MVPTSLVGTFYGLLDRVQARGVTGKRGMRTTTFPPDIDALWEESLGDPEICVAVLDGPVDLGHPSLSGALLTVIPTSSPVAVRPGAACLHGTHVASLIFGGHGAGEVRGIAPRCRGLIVPIYSDDPGGTVRTCSQVELARAIAQAAAGGANVINISGGQLAFRGLAHPMLAEAVRRCVAGRVLIVAAAGNDSCDCLHVPGALPSVLAVGASRPDGEPADFSNWGDAYAEQGILAPGVGILGARCGGGLVRLSGTSVAAAGVAGVAALLLSIQRKRGIAPDPLSVRDALLRGATGRRAGFPEEGRRLLAGRLSGTRALSVLMSGGEASMSEPQSHEVLTGVASDVAGSGGGHLGHASTDAAPGLLAVAPMLAPEAGPPEIGGGIGPAACGCQSQKGPSSCSQARVAPRPPQLVYALGQVGYDFGSESRRDSFRQAMGADPYDPTKFLAYLEENPEAATSLTWTLNIDATPIYAVHGMGPYAHLVYERLREFLGQQQSGGVERVSIPGILAGSTTLMTGQRVPVVVPESRGMYSWSTRALVSAVSGGPETAAGGGPPGKDDQVANFLERIYYELRNVGLMSQERAINYAATNALQVEFIYRGALSDGLGLDRIEVEPSPICRPGSDCWDVKLIFFHPTKRQEIARRVYRFTVDVSDTIPVTVGPVRQWAIY